MLLSGCSSKVEYKYIKPPQALLTKCESFKFKGKTYGDLVIYTRKLQSKYFICRKQIDELNDWLIAK